MIGIKDITKNKNISIFVFFKSFSRLITVIIMNTSSIKKRIIIIGDIFPSNLANTLSIPIPNKDGIYYAMNFLRLIGERLNILLGVIYILLSLLI